MASARLHDGGGGERGGVPKPLHQQPTPPTPSPPPPSPQLAPSPAPLEHPLQDEKVEASLVAAREAAVAASEADELAYDAWFASM